MPMELDPRVRRFQEIKAARRAKKVREVEAIAKIKTANPNLTDKQALQVYEAHIRQQQAQTIRVKGRNGKPKTVKVFHA